MLWDSRIKKQGCLSTRTREAALVEGVGWLLVVAEMALEDPHLVLLMEVEHQLQQERLGGHQLGLQQEVSFNYRSLMYY